jgi:thiol:disulfide interchange protein DsbC
LIALALVAGAPLALAADPGEIALLQQLKQLYPATQWTTVTRTPIAGVYEVAMGTNIAYVGDDARHFLFGHLFDMRTQTDLTAPKLVNSPASADAEPASSVAFASLPLADAIKTVKGNGSRVLAVLSDPNCPYCKLLDDELAKLDDVTVYTFLLPWVNPDRTAALAAWKQAVPQRAGDTAVLDRNLTLAARLRLRGTPLLIAGDGRINEGAMRVRDLDAWLGSGDAHARNDTEQRSPETTP